MARTGVRIEGLTSTFAAIDRIGKRTSKGALRAVRRGAKKIMRRAQEYAPIDTGRLEEAITTAESTNVYGRKTIYVGVDENELGEGYSTYGFRYDIYMHEAVYHLGEASQEKAERLGVDVGPKYLERAIKDYAKEIDRDVRAEVKKATV